MELMFVGSWADPVPLTWVLACMHLILTAVCRLLPTQLQAIFEAVIQLLRCEHQSLHLPKCSRSAGPEGVAPLLVLAIGADHGTAGRSRRAYFINRYQLKDKDEQSAQAMVKFTF